MGRSQSRSSTRFWFSLKIHSLFWSNGFDKVKYLSINSKEGEGINKFFIESKERFFMVEPVAIFHICF